MRIPSGVTDQYVYFVAVDATDFTTRETGLSSFTVYRARNGGSAAAMTTPTISQVSSSNMPGVYALLLDEDMTIASGNDTEAMVFHITHAGMAPVTIQIELYRPKITAGNTLSVESDGDLTEVNTLTGHVAQTGDNYPRLGTPAGASIAADIADVDSDIAALNDPTEAVIADAVWDEARSGHVTAGTFGETLATVESNIDNLDAPVSTVDSVVDNINADIDSGTYGLSAIKTAIDNLNDISVGDVLETAMTEAYSADGSAPTLTQAIFLILQFLYERSVSGTTVTVAKLDGSTTAAQATLNDGTSPTSITRSS